MQANKTSNADKTHKLLILDFGSQYSQLIARRVRELGVFCEWMSCHADPEIIKAFQPSGIILSGGPETVLDSISPRIPDVVFELDVPVLGICYGMQAMAIQLGGAVGNNHHSEFGHANLNLNAKLSSPLLKDMTNLNVWMSHGDQVTHLPKGFAITASSENTQIAVMENKSKKLYGVQFHPEVTHTPDGKKLFENFVFEICGCEQNWTSENIIDHIVTDIRKKVGKDKVLLGLSGGVDSLVTAVLIHKAIGAQLVCIYIDHGLQRLQESDYLLNHQARELDLNILVSDAQDWFLSKLEGVEEPEQKRKIIGRLFIDVFMKEAKRFPSIKWLAQGTIYSDVIESAKSGTSSHTIKSHHNVGGLPAKLHLKLIEPLRELFKDEVRKIGVALGLPYKDIYRHPFPGPGLALRVLGPVTKEALDTVRKADFIFMEELHKNDLYHKVSQAFCVFLPVKSVGVVGDARLYAPIIALRAVESTDFMTATSAHLSHDFLEHVARRIINEVKNVSRVVYDITSKPPATIEWE
ncbi:MAG TPA: glutamine-hydrolyzing GMP synthase [Gammaproteobacteria bacterium]|nr:glutamine-hydrolyzing GMP synthase [Gammaproteobacteria bacterium]